MNSCEFCGAMLEAGATTCSKCGSAVRVAVRTPTRAPSFGADANAGFPQLGSAVPAGARCAVHLANPATFICKRCGSFACTDCRSYMAEGYCQKCNVGSVGIKASRGSRFVANLIDNAVVAIIPIVMIFIMAIVVGASAGKGRGGEDAIAIFMVLGMFAAFIAGCGAQVWAQVTWGQSIGKRAMGIKVVRTNGDPIEVWRLILMRNVLIHVIAQLCGLVGLVDALLIFGEEERCLHDYIADTIVVVADPPN